MTDELKPCPFCGSPARLNRSTGESLWSHDQVEWTQVQCTNEDCGVATENRCEGWEPTPIESWNSRALTAAQPAQEGGVDAKCQTCNGHGLVGGHMQDGSGYGEGCPDCNPEPAPLVKWASTQPAAQATRTTADTLREIKAASCKDCAATGYTDPGEADSPDGPGRPAVVCGSCSGTGWRDGVHISDQQAKPASADDMEVYDSMAADYFADARQATPEPVGEQAAVPRDAYDALESERDYWRARARAMIDHADGTCWYWVGDGEDHLDSLVNSLPVVIRADQLRDLLAHPAPGVPEGWRMDREGDDVIVVRHQAVGLARATNPATSMHGQILFALCDDILQDRKSLTAAQQGAEQP